MLVHLLCSALVQRLLSFLEMHDPFPPADLAQRMPYGQRKALLPWHRWLHVGKGVGRNARLAAAGAAGYVLMLVCGLSPAQHSTCSSAGGLTHVVLMHLKLVAEPVHLVAGAPPMPLPTFGGPDSLTAQGERGYIWRSRAKESPGMPVEASLFREAMESVTGLSCALSCSCSSATPWRMPAAILPVKLHRGSVCLLA